MKNKLEGERFSHRHLAPDNLSKLKSKLLAQLEKMRSSNTKHSFRENLKWNIPSDDTTNQSEDIKGTPSCMDPSW